ncbi:MAG TPA: FecR family protein [Sphingomicrobium sp.]
MSTDVAATPVDDAFEDAALWCVRLSEGGLSDDEWDEFEAWLCEPGHADLFQQATAVWQASEAIGDWPQIIALRTRALTQYRKSNQRRWLAPSPRRMQRIAASVGVLLLTMTAFLLWHVNRPSEYETGIGERRIAMLDDGSRVSLDAATIVKVRIEDEGRHVELLEGRAKFDVAKDPLRPFTVAVGDKLVVAVGTSFSVELIDREVRVILYEGEVEVRNRSDTAQSPGAMPPRHLMAAGSELSHLVGSSEPAQIRRPDLPQSLSWEQGMVNFDDEPLASAIERINRYATKRLRLADPALGNIRVNGIFRTGDVDAFVEGVTALHPIRGKIVGDEIILNHKADPPAARVTTHLPGAAMARAVE